VCGAVSRTLALGPLLLLLLASSCCRCLGVISDCSIVSRTPFLRGATYHFVGCVVVLRGVPVSEES
jgi:hypothetical protein